MKKIIVVILLLVSGIVLGQDVTHKYSKMIVEQGDRSELSFKVDIHLDLYVDEITVYKIILKDFKKGTFIDMDLVGFNGNIVTTQGEETLVGKYYDGENYITIQFFDRGNKVRMLYYNRFIKLEK